MRSISDKTKIAQGRGTGRFQKYKPWINANEVSGGTSWAVPCRLVDRQIQCLSTIEYHVCLIILFSRNVVEIREQFPLPLRETLAVAKKLNIDHGGDESGPRIMSTDFYVTVREGRNNVFYAISVKYLKELKSKRVREKLSVEEAYYSSLGVRWILITEQEIDETFIGNILRWTGRLRHRYAFVKKIPKLFLKCRSKQLSRLSEFISFAAKELKVSNAEVRAAFEQLIITKKVEFDYFKPFSYDLPFLDFSITI